MSPLRRSIDAELAGSPLEAVSEHVRSFRAETVYAVMGTGAGGWAASLPERGIVEVTYRRSWGVLGEGPETEGRVYLEGPPGDGHVEDLMARAARMIWADLMALA